MANLPVDQYRTLRPRLRDIYLAAYRGLPQYAYVDPHRVESYLDWVRAGDPRGLFVATLSQPSSLVVGFAAAHGSWRQHRGPPIAELHELAVDPTFRGQGAGTLLVRGCVQYAAALGRGKIALWVGEHNERAIALYTRLGFKRVSQWGCWVRMALALANAIEDAIAPRGPADQAESLPGASADAA